MALEGVVYPEDPRTLECKDIIDTEELPGLFDSVRTGAWELPHRIVMAPLTRARTGSDRTPKALNARYYAQRATAALIISEATIISEQAAGYAFTPGIYNEAQIAGWKLVTDAVKRQPRLPAGLGERPGFHRFREQRERAQLVQWHLPLGSICAKNAIINCIVLA